MLRFYQLGICMTFEEIMQIVLWFAASGKVEPSEFSFSAQKIKKKLGIAGNIGMSPWPQLDHTIANSAWLISVDPRSVQEYCVCLSRLHIQQCPLHHSSASDTITGSCGFGSQKGTYSKHRPFQPS